MKSILHVSLLLLLLSLASIVRAGDRELILALEQRYGEAIRGDWKALEELLAPDFFYNTAEGASVARDPFVAHLRTGTVQLGEARREQVQVRFHGDVAVVTALTRLQARIDGVDRSIASRHLHVWVRQRDRWQLSARQVTYVR